MPIVQSFGALRALAPDARPASLMPAGGSSLSLYGLTAAYRTIYATQPNVRTCVDFLARNLAQIPLHAYRRVSDTDRVRLADHDLVRWFARPNPWTCRYRLFEDLICDLGIYFTAYWLKARYTDEQNRKAMGFIRLPPEEIEVEGGLAPTTYHWTRGGRTVEFAPSDVAAFRGFNPLNPLIGLSTLETLRRILAEEAASNAHRAAFWLNAARHEGVIEITKDAPNWTPTQIKDFRGEWQEFASGGAKVGQTAVLPKGMTYKQTSFSAKDSEYLLGRKLTREECAAAYHIPQPFVGILDHATFSNIREQHKNLYQDTLGPWLEWIQEELEAQVLVESDDQQDVYLEFNINDKLKGNFEETASSLQILVGRPIMTANEGRARLNLPQIDDPSADQLAPQQGGPAQPSTTATPVDDSTTALALLVVEQHWQRQRAKLARIPAEERAAAFDHTRCTRELAADLAPLFGPLRARSLATRINDDTYARLVQGAADAFAARAVDFAEVP